MSLDAEVRLSSGPALEWRTVEVPTEFGQVAVIDFYRHREREGFWTVDISQELVDSSPEGLTAALLMAFRELSSEAQ